MTMLYVVNKKRAGLRIGVSGYVAVGHQSGYSKDPTDPLAPLIKFPELEISIAAMQTLKSVKVQHV